MNVAVILIGFLISSQVFADHQKCLADGLLVKKGSFVEMDLTVPLLTLFQPKGNGEYKKMELLAEKHLSSQSIDVKENECEVQYVNEKGVADFEYECENLSSFYESIYGGLEFENETGVYWESLHSKSSLGHWYFFIEDCETIQVEK